MLDGQCVGARYIAHIEKIAFGVKIANAQHRLNQPCFNPSDLHRECRDCKALGLTGAYVIEGTQPYHSKSTSNQCAENKIGSCLGYSIVIDGSWKRIFVERLAGSCGFAIDQPGSDIQQPASWRIFEDCLRQIAGSANVDGPCHSWIARRRINCRKGGKMKHMCGRVMGNGGSYRCRVRDIQCVHISKDGMCAAYFGGSYDLDFAAADAAQSILGMWADKPIRARHQNPRHLAFGIINADAA